MGKLALAAKITHVPSMYLSELPGPRQGTRQDAIDGHVEIGRRCRELGVDTIVVFDTHWLVNANYHVNCAPHFKGAVHQQRAAALHQQHGLRVPGQPGARASCWPRRPTSMGVETLAHDATTLGPEYGTLVPMRYMNADQHFKVVSVSALCMAHYLNDSARLGWALRRAVEEHYDGTVAFFASGSLEPPLRAERPGAGVRASRSGARSWSSWTTRSSSMWQARRMAGLLRDAARVRRQGPRRRLHARHRDAAGRAGLERLRRAGRDRHALLRRSGTGQINAVFPVTPQDGRAIPKPVASAAEGYSSIATRL